MPKRSEVKLKCLLHRITPDDSKTCLLCKAKREAGGNFEKARRNFVRREK